MLSTILSNPRRPHRNSRSTVHWDGGVGGGFGFRIGDRSSVSAYQDEESRIISRATLVVVPVSLVGQWAEVSEGRVLFGWVGMSWDSRGEGREGRGYQEGGGVGGVHSFHV